MPSAPTTSIDLSAADIVADPYPSFAHERSQHEVAWHEPSGTWLTFSHAAAGAVLRNRRLGRIWRDREPVDYLEPFNLLHRNQMMENEPPEHTRLRRAVAGAFNRGHVERLRPRVRSLAASLLAEVDCGRLRRHRGVRRAAARPGDRRADRALQRRRARPAGLVAGDRADVRANALTSRWSTLQSSLPPSSPTWCREHLDRRRIEPGDDLTTDLLAAGLSDDELVAAVVLLLNAGHEASVNVFGNGLVALLSRGLRPGADPAVTVEEMLRFDSALQLFERTATAQVEVGGVVVEQGQKIAALLGAANRDPAVFADADTFAVDRDPNPHLAFGAGLHFCLGAPLARMELVESLITLFARFPELGLVGEPESRGTFVLRGFRRVVVGGSGMKGA